MSKAKKMKPDETPKAARLDRAEKRGLARNHQAPKMGRNHTALGPVTLTDRGRGKGGYVTTRKKDYPGSTKTSQTNGSYSALLGAARPETMRVVIRESKNRSQSTGLHSPTPDTSINDPDQKRIGATLIGIGLAEEQRSGKSPKPFRAGLREAVKAAAKGEDGNARAKEFYNAFPQGAPASMSKELGIATGARAFQKPVSSSVADERRAKSRNRAGSFLSDSSSDG